MPIDPDAALSATPSRKRIAWTTGDVLLYHLSLGSGRGDDPELRWTFERDLQVLPTFALVAGQGPSAGDLPPAAMHLPGIDIDLRRILHGGQELTVHRPLPTSGEAIRTSRIAEIHDKGKAAVIVLEISAEDLDGEPLWSTRMHVWARGEGGFGGDPGPDTTWAAPERGPDLVLDTPTSADQALLYRLNGDRNPLHADPEFARAAAFPKPILHGLASYGVVARALVDQVLDGDASRLTGLDVRFAGTVEPGQSLRTEVWREADGLLFTTGCPERDDAPVLSRGTARVS